MTTKATGTAPLILTVFALVCGAIISGAVPRPVAYAQLPYIHDTVNDTLKRAGITEQLGEEDTNNLERQQQQPRDPENDQELRQEVVDRSENTYGTNTNIEIKSQVDDQDSAQTIVNGKDLGESSSESAYVKEKYSRSDSSSSDTHKTNEQRADNGEEIKQGEEETVNQDKTWMFGDDAADLEPTDLNPTNIAIPIAIPAV
jgi:hypothetical protein